MIPTPANIKLIINSHDRYIWFAYDPLYRLTEANYSTGDYCHYSYDAVGNRLSQETLIGSVPLTTNYVYDAANRLTSVDSVTYTWDNNGNLLNDGTNTYSYNPANQLTAMSGPFGSSTFSYNGLGDRLTQKTPSLQSLIFTPPILYSSIPLLQLTNPQAFPHSPLAGAGAA